MLILSKAANKDIEKLLEHSVLEFGVAQTEIYFNSLKRCLLSLADNPVLGHSAEDIKTGYRRFAHQSHVIFYQIQEQDIFIVRILHKAMDVDKQFDGQIEEPVLAYV